MLCILFTGLSSKNGRHSFLLDSLLLRIFGGYGHGKRRKKMDPKFNAIDSSSIFLGKDDVALVLREHEEALEMYVPGLNDPMEQAPSRAFFIASWLAYAYGSKKPEVRAAFEIIKNNCIKETDQRLDDYINSINKKE
jgi:hypothetical protein